MRPEDLILVSVDDHVVEPPDLFDRHLPARWKEHAPRSVHDPERGIDVWVFEDQVIPNIGLNAVAGRPPRNTTSSRPPTPRSVGGATTCTSGCRT